MGFRWFFPDSPCLSCERVWECACESVSNLCLCRHIRRTFALDEILLFLPTILNHITTESHMGLSRTKYIHNHRQHDIDRWKYNEYMFRWVILEITTRGNRIKASVFCYKWFAAIQTNVWMRTTSFRMSETNIALQTAAAQLSFRFTDSCIRCTYYTLHI